MLLNARRFSQAGNQSELILLAIEDITERRHAEEGRREIETRFTSLVKKSATGCACEISAPLTS